MAALLEIDLRGKEERGDAGRLWKWRKERSLFRVPYPSHVSQILSQDRVGEDPAWTTSISYTVK